jgi:adenylate cyclase
MPQTFIRTVLFADLRGSTALYETLGNTEATMVVTRSVDLLSRIVGTNHGTLVKTLGDGLMAVFANASQAINAADEMQESLDRITPPAGLTSAARSRCSNCNWAWRMAKSSRWRAIVLAMPSTSPRAS